MAMRDIGSHAPRLKAMGGPKALGNRLRSRRRVGSGRIGAGVGKPRRWPAGPAASLLPARWPDGPPARSLWVTINETWYQFPWRRDGGRISTNLNVIRGTSALES